jgi:AAA15 family ATPase/GTPase
MLTSIRIQNYRSIQDCTVDLSFDEKKAPNGYRDEPLLPFITDNGFRSTSVLALYGANGSGKSAIVNALIEASWVVANGVSLQSFHPNCLCHCGNATTLTCCLVRDGKTYEYELCYTGESILHEHLLEDKEPLFTAEQNSITTLLHAKEELYSDEKLKVMYKIECCDSNQKQIHSFLSRLGKNYQNLDGRVTKVYKELFWSFCATPATALEVGDAYHSFLAAEMIAYGVNDEEKSKRKLLEIVKRLDVSVQDFQYKKGDSNSQKIPFLTDWKTAHTDMDGKQVWLDLERDESNGTKTLFRLVPLMLGTLDLGGVLVIDEIDRSLHPLLLGELVKLFKDKRNNVHNAQLICTLHDTDLLDANVLRVSDVGIISKTLKEGTKIKRLSQFKGVRNVTNFRKQYLEGCFGGIPFPSL